MLEPETVAELLRARATQLEEDLAQRRGSAALRRAELEYVRRLISDLQDGSLDGLQWWSNLHQEAADR